MARPPFFRSGVGETGMLTEKPMNRIEAYRTVRRCWFEAGFKG
jgi:hypothetical protein